MTKLRRLPFVAGTVAVLATLWSAVPAYAATTGSVTPELAVSKKPIAIVGVIVLVVIVAGVAVWYTRRDK